MRIAILDDYQNVATEIADWSGLDVTVFNEPLEDPAMSLKAFEIICIMRERTPFPRELIEQLPNLKLLVTSGKRNAAIDKKAAKECGVIVCGTRSPGHATAELTWGLILSLTRQIPAQFRNVQEGGWQLGLGCDLRGKTLAVIGLGRMGSQVARIAQAFGMDVIAWSRNLTDSQAAEQDVKRVEKEDLFKQADIISIHMKYGPSIQHLVGEAEFALMKKTAYLINTSRAPIIDTTALISALNSQEIAGAGLDVYDIEPLPKGHPLRSAPNCILTPHVGYVTKETYEVFYGETVDIVRRYLAGETLTVMT
ncbi:D-2-hydroxyacid dehydrogenase family protein [Terasakiella sp. SH-1]|uniref:D-2-hydroxyacid dehydrogenase family protein n=1 Tax=Terasakiella sp. SH-1 TaxID=2560057 RepID=UPI0010739637|nr:D-2-hydroxyacid dehydrogenase family protein [Terasakiella sp. SH-1]